MLVSLDEGDNDLTLVATDLRGAAVGSDSIRVTYDKAAR